MYNMFTNIENTISQDVKDIENIHLPKNFT